MRILITGTAGFIGFHLARRMLADGHAVVGIDGITPYYDQVLKRRRHAMLAEFPAFSAHEMMIEEAERLNAVVAQANADRIIHLAAQAGVRYSAENPRAYIDANVIGTFNLLEAVRQHPCQHLMIASTSSLYGANRQQPFAEHHCTEQPLSLYAATKKAAEAMAFTNAHLTDTPTTLMRFFTVYGPWGRPDMALFKFTQNIILGEPIEVYGEGRMSRDFTYIDDVVESICLLADRVPTRDSLAKSGVEAPAAPCRVVNIGSDRPVTLEDFIATIERAVGREAIRRLLPMQPGDVRSTHASIAVLEKLTGFRPRTPIADGVRNFVAWYRDYFQV